MRNVVAVVALVAAMVPVGCGGSDESVPPPAVPVAPTPPPPAPAPTADTTPVAPAAPQKQVVTITTKSPDAKAALLAAWDLADSGRFEESLDQCKKAVAADPDFAFGHSCVGSMTPGAAGQAELDQGAKLAAGLPDAERFSIEGAAAQRHQDTATYVSNVKRVADLAPDDPHAQQALAWSLVDQRDFPGATIAFKKVLDLNPNASFAYLGLTFIHTQLREYDDALASAKKAVDAAPSDAGAHRTLAFALIGLNRTKDAEGEFAKALDLSPKSRWAFNDFATVKALNGDYAGARDLLEKSKTAETQPSDALDRATNVAWTYLDEGKTADAFKLLDATEKDSDARALPWPAQEAVVRAWAFWGMGKSAEALRAADAGMARCNRPESSDAYKAECRRDTLTVKAFAQVQAGKIPDAQKTVALLQDEAKKSQGNNWIQMGVDLLSSQVTALANKDAKAAFSVFANCPPDDVRLKVSILRLAEKSGNKDGAEQVRKDVLGRPRYDIAYPFYARLAKK